MACNEQCPGEDAAERIDEHEVVRDLGSKLLKRQRIVLTFKSKPAPRGLEDHRGQPLHEIR